LLGRETPEVTCSVFFEEAEWQELSCCHRHTPTPPATRPALSEATRRVATLGGYLARTGDGHPGTTVRWRCLDKFVFITDTYTLFLPALHAGP
jgi:hypothetical protein